MDATKMSEDELLDKLEFKYRRPMEKVCCVCGGKMTTAHKGGGLPLRWVCEVAKQKVDAGQSEEAKHLEESMLMDYRAVGDARVLQLVQMYRGLRSRMDVIKGQAEVGKEIVAMDENS